MFDNFRQSKAVNFQKTEAIRAEILKRQPSPEEVQEALVQRTKDALKIIVEHGALSSGDFAEKLYSDSPRWEMEENAREAKKLLRDLTKRGLLQYCRKSHVYYRVTVSYFEFSSHVSSLSYVDVPALRERSRCTIGRGAPRLSPTERFAEGFGASGLPDLLAASSACRTA